MMDKTTSMTPENKVPRRRRTYVINPSFQWKCTLMIIGTVFVLSGFLTVVLFNVLHQQARARVMTPMTVSTVDNMTMLVLAAAAFGVLMALALGISVFVFTHRIAGPVYVIGRALEELAAGKIPQIRPLRKSDEFKDVHDALCGTVKRLESDLKNQIAMMTELYNLAQTVSADTNVEGKAVCDELVRRIDTQRSAVLDLLGDMAKSSGAPASAAASDPNTELSTAAAG